MFGLCSFHLRLRNPRKLSRLIPAPVDYNIAIHLNKLLLTQWKEVFWNGVAWQEGKYFFTPSVTLLFICRGRVDFSAIKFSQIYAF